MPTLDAWVRQGSGWRKKQSVMFPRYGFVRPAHAAQAIGAVRSTPGVTSLVRFGHALGLFDHARLVALQTLVHQLAQATPQQPLRAGNHVVFASGPLQGAQGIVSAVARERVAVLMTLMGKQHRVTVPLNVLALQGSRAGDIAQGCNP